jgi:hypothetical protein
MTPDPKMAAGGSLVSNNDEPSCDKRPLVALLNPRPGQTSWGDGKHISSKREALWNMPRAVSSRRNKDQLVNLITSGERSKDGLKNKKWRLKIV